MKKNLFSLSYLIIISAFFASCSSSDSETPAEEGFYKIINNGGGGVNSITDTADTQSLGIAQAIPSVSNEIYPANMPILFFFNDKILLSSITQDSFVVKENNTKVSGTISINEAANGFAIFTFTPKNKFAADADIEITLTTELKDDSGTGLDSDQVISYRTASTTDNSFDGNGGFETGIAGVNFIGDGNVLSGAHGCINPFEGNNFASITSGNQLISSGTAIGEASSIMIIGPINANITSINFNYNFLSAEFQEFVGSEYDDSFMAIVYGANGAHSEFVTSVNTIGKAGNTSCDGFIGMPDTGDGYAGSTGWLSKSINFSSVGDEVYIAFIVTDVSDQVYSSVVSVDDITYN
ncbi:Ig-like domain-containing protein [Flavobacterium sp.]|uniref:Ig-like domain-containing protein n=1 Tax=Flavobacterium sp. TaxID=239 RepID=UPI00286D44DD|nr:Ig-like domain-containing protein [Flavobacterium sp.]